MAKLYTLLILVIYQSIWPNACLLQTNHGLHYFDNKNCSRNPFCIPPKTDQNNYSTVHITLKHYMCLTCADEYTPTVLIVYSLLILSKLPTK